MSTDKRTIGITSSNERILAELVAAGHFGSELEASKFAMAYAIERQIPVGAAEGAATKWNIGTVDSDGSLKLVVEALYPSCGEPYRLVEHLMNEGLKLLDAGAGMPPDVAGVLFQTDTAG
jgi:hypothetical protein